ncbi:MAG: hypothetical protein GC160_20695 [Acidobacteria bacterium]|nr:hypothetical protein [Acidobacteriota bacterium]
MPVALLTRLLSASKAAQKKRSDRPYLLTAKAVSATVSLLGAVVLLAWRFDFEAAKSLLPSFATMKANTALCFLASGVALWHLAGPVATVCSPSRRGRILAAAAAGLTLTLSLLTVSQYVFSFDAGIDELLFADNSTAPQETVYPGRMSPATAVSFLLLALALLALALDRLRSKELAQHLSVAVGWIAFVAIVGYAHGGPGPFGGSPVPVLSHAFASMALHTSVGLLLLAAGAFVIRPRHGLMAAISSPSLGGRMARQLLPLAAAVAAFLFVLGIVGHADGDHGDGFSQSLLAVFAITLLASTIWRSAAALNQLDAQRLDAEEKLLLSLKEKESLLKEIHHRVKNNLQIVSSLLSLQSRRTSGDEARRVFEESQARIHAMALIHEHLYRSNDLDNIDFSTYLRELVGHILRLHAGPSSKISAHVEVGDARFPVDVAIPCALIVNEAVLNSLKYGFPAGGPGEVRIRFEQTDERSGSLAIQDNGVGFPADFDPASSASLGVRLIQALARQLGGDAEFSSPHGALVRIEFRLQADARTQPAQRQAAAGA